MAVEAPLPALLPRGGVEEGLRRLENPLIDVFILHLPELAAAAGHDDVGVGPLIQAQGEGGQAAQGVLAAEKVRMDVAVVDREPRAGEGLGEGLGGATATATALLPQLDRQLLLAVQVGEARLLLGAQRAGRPVVPGPHAEEGVRVGVVEREGLHAWPVAAQQGAGQVGAVCCLGGGMEGSGCL